MAQDTAESAVLNRAAGRMREGVDGNLKACQSLSGNRVCNPRTATITERMDPHSLVRMAEKERGMEVARSCCHPEGIAALRMPRSRDADLLPCQAA